MTDINNPIVCHFIFHVKKFEGENIFVILSSKIFSHKKREREKGNFLRQVGIFFINMQSINESSKQHYE